MKKEDLKESFGTLSQTINGLNEAGYTYDFNNHGNCIICHQTSAILQPEDFKIDKVYRFEGDSNPDDEAVVYAISSDRFNMKGVMVNGYGISAEDEASQSIQNLQTNTASYDK